jgi:hypothetical protein
MMEQFDYHTWIQQCQVYKDHPSICWPKIDADRCYLLKNPNKIGIPARFDRRTETFIPRKVLDFISGTMDNVQDISPVYYNKHETSSNNRSSLFMRH